MLGCGFSARLSGLPGWSLTHQCCAHGTRCRAPALLGENAAPATSSHCINQESCAHGPPFHEQSETKTARCLSIPRAAKAFQNLALASGTNLVVIRGVEETLGRVFGQVADAPTVLVKLHWTGKQKKIRRTKEPWHPTVQMPVICALIVKMTLKVNMLQN